MDIQEKDQSSGSKIDKRSLKGSKRKNMHDFLIKKNVNRAQVEKPKKVATANSDIEGIITNKTLNQMESKKAVLTPNKIELPYQKSKIPTLRLNKNATLASNDEEDEFERKLKHMRAMSFYKNNYQYKTIEN